jgi:hypothetical protein
MFPQQQNRQKNRIYDLILYIYVATSLHGTENVTIHNLIFAHTERGRYTVQYDTYRKN